jgi:hypothetical protein
VAEDVNMDPKPVPTGGETPPGSGGIEGTPPPPEAGIIDNPPPAPEPETHV